MFPPAGQQEIDDVFHKGIHCHNRINEGHYSTSCPHPKVTFHEREIIKAKIKNVTGDMGGMSRPNESKRPTAAVSKGEANTKQQWGDALEEVNGSTGRMMNSLGMANVVIPKEPNDVDFEKNTVEEWRQLQTGRAAGANLIPCL